MSDELPKEVEDAILTYRRAGQEFDRAAPEELAGRPRVLDELKALRLAITTALRDAVYTAVAREAAARIEPMPAEELAAERPSVVALSRIADEAVARGWDEAAGHLREAARSLSSAICNIGNGSEALAERLRPINLKWARETAELLGADIRTRHVN